METALKQRLVGATVLVALAVIFLPMLVKGPAPESGVADVPIDVPQPGFETREIPLGAPSAAGTATGMPAPAAGDRLPTVDTGSATAGAVSPAATAAGDYAVSFGSYATDSDAARVVAALKASELPAYHEPVPASGGRTLHRVRIGPYAGRPEAEAARLRAARVNDRVDAKVVTLDAAAGAAVASAPASAPTAAATAPSASVAQPLSQAPAVASAPVPLPPSQPAAAPAAPKSATAAPAVKPPAPAPVATPAAASSVGFAVQLGAFGNAGEAAKLRDRARAAGFTAFTEEVRTDKGTLNRVRVGPVADRTEAERLRAQVSASLGVAGLVRPHP